MLVSARRVTLGEVIEAVGRRMEDKARRLQDVEFTIENGLLTPTLKLKKNVAIAQYEEAINAMYPDD